MQQNNVGMFLFIDRSSLSSIGIFCLWVFIPKVMK